LAGNPIEDEDENSDNYEEEEQEEEIGQILDDMNDSEFDDN
jgi:hypothetical protein